MSQRDIDSYQEWISKDSSLAATQHTFLGPHEDLVTITGRTGFDAPGSERFAIATGFGILMTIIAFKITPLFLPRLVVGTVIGIAMCCSGMSLSRMDIHCLREYGRRVLV